jgi:hypothetical protein
LLDPFAREAWVYGAHTEPRHIIDPGTLTGDPILPGFRFDFSEIAQTE